MDKNAKWIWLDSQKYVDYQKAPVSLFDPYSETSRFAIAEFQKKTGFDKKIKKINVNISADVKFWLYVNGEYVGCGPVGAGGDYGIDRPMPYQYYNSYSIEMDTPELEFYVMVQNVPTVLCDMSQGKNGLILSAEILLEDGRKEKVVTDESWSVRIDRRRYAHNRTDYTIRSEEWTKATEAEGTWVLKKPDILMLAEEEVIPEGFSSFSVQPGEMKEVTFYFDKIYSIYHHVELEGTGAYMVMLRDFERYEEKDAQITEWISGTGNLDFRGLTMVSAGGMKVFIYNGDDQPLQVKKISGYFVHYPIQNEGYFECSEECLNKIFKMGRHALKICRQSIELDSPLHQENLGCAGDYYISSLMNYFTDGDTKLTRLDLVRIADSLKIYEGYMFHTTYSMIWLMMIHDYYMFSGDETIIEEVADAISLLMEKMHSYVNAEEIIDHPASYMFVDWLVVDGISLHHPPAALGQAILNAFYYGGLNMAAKLMEKIGLSQRAANYHDRAEVLKESFQKNFYDPDRGLYFDGHNFEHESGEWMQPNVDKRYYSWHTNTIAVLYDLAPQSEQKRIMETILNDMTLINPQPYFMHFVLEAIAKVGLFEEYGMQQLMRWKDMTEFEKGLQEGWYDMSGYGFDYSHVWAGTPTYQLPSKLSGFEMLEPGFKKIRLNPRLYGLEYAYMQIPTCYGMIDIRMEAGKEPVVLVPEEIQVVR